MEVFHTRKNYNSSNWIIKNTDIVAGLLEKATKVAFFSGLSQKEQS